MIVPPVTIVPSTESVEPCEIVSVRYAFSEPEANVAEVTQFAKAYGFSVSVAGAGIVFSLL